MGKKNRTPDTTSNTNSAANLLARYLAWPGNARWASPSGCWLGMYSQEYLCPSDGLRKKTRVWKSGRSVAETRTRSVFWVYMTYMDLVMAALSCW